MDTPQSVLPRFAHQLCREWSQVIDWQGRETAWPKAFLHTSFIKLLSLMQSEQIHVDSQQSLTRNAGRFLLRM